MSLNRDREFDLEGLQSQFGFATVRLFDSLASTNDFALSGAVAPAELPALVLAHEQTRGRGRGANRWQSGLGSLTFSVAIDSDQLAGTPATLLSIGTAFAMATAVERLVSRAELQQECRAMIKWPNDVVLNDRKLAGVLIESRDGKVVVGIGMNVHGNDHPETGTSLASEAGAEFDLQEVLDATLAEFFSMLDLASCCPVELLTGCRDRLSHDGEQVSIRVGQEIVKGRIAGLGPGGELVLLRGGKETFVASGSDLRVGLE